MSANLTRPRPDITYLRRRLKPGETPPKQETKPAASSLTLNLTTDSGEVTTPAWETPLLTESTILTEKDPVRRLSKVTSGVGSLAFINTSHVAWQLTDGTTGVLYAPDSDARNTPITMWDGSQQEPYPEIPTPTHKNRSFIEYHKGFLVVNLRSIKNIKRFILAPKAGQDIIGGTQNNANVTVPYEEGAVLYCSVVDSHIELRWERYFRSVTETFNIGTRTIPTPAQATSLQDLFNNR